MSLPAFLFAATMSGMLWRFYKFVFVGSCATAIQYMLLTFLVEMYDLRASVASTIGFVVAAAVNYLLNRRFTFQSTARHSTAILKFLSVALVGVTLNAALIGWFEAHTTVHYLLAQTFATTVVLLWNYAGNAIWTFRTAQ
jgi:putative flippase GtrA